MTRDRVHIHSRGSALDTTITNIVDDKESILSVREATIRLEAGEINRVDLDLVGPSIEVDATVDTVTMTCPICDWIETHRCSEKK